jgi:DNA primase
MDPCELRQHGGDAAVVALIDSRRPLFEFAIQASLRKHDLNTVEGRVAALREAAPVVAQIRDHAIRPAYTRELAKWLGMAPDDVSRAVGAASRRPPSSAPASAPTSALVEGSAPQRSARPDFRDPVATMERQALEVILQHPELLDDDAWLHVGQAHFTAPAYQAVHAALGAAGRPESGREGLALWMERLRDESPEPLRPLLAELAVTPLPAATPESLERYCRDILAGLFELQITARKAELMGQLQRLEPEATADERQRLNRELMELELRRRQLRQRD